MEGYIMFGIPFDIIKMSIFPKLTCTFKKNSTKIPVEFVLCGNQQANSKIYMKRQRAKNDQNSFEEKKLGEFKLLDIKTYSKALVIKTANSMIMGHR